ncbi:BCCT family transporter [Halobellus limi]|uniref:BCCT transporter n=1 Tax=Halobellus limi TaxID=699433 RepID=A0A1H6C0F7_9EURY|nr:BCCT family transporter [Halobellus limi]QCC48513.1 BCCT transporter [Halobellus limi]SEG66392.1 glycine betaine transporter [Halobellus limi]
MSTDDRNYVEKFRSETNPIVFAGGVLLTVAIIAALGAKPAVTGEFLSSANSWVVSNLGWFYLWVIFLAFVFAIFLLLGPWGQIKLGSPDEEPEFSYWKYFVMMFTAGMAGGLAFWGPGEGLVHYSTAPPLLEAGAGTQEIMPGALQYAIFHTGLSPWSVYVVFGVVIAFFAYRRGASLRPAVLLAPFIGADNLDGFLGKSVDILITVISVAGITVSFGAGITQLLSGLGYNWGIEVGDIGTVVITLLATIVVTTSASLGIRRGIRRLATFNIYLFIGLMLSVLIFGPLTFLLNLGTLTVSSYFTNFIEMSLFIGSSPEAVQWLSSWTLFFWPWWLSFGPMIGIFIARISRGRKIREVVFAALVVAFAITVPWFVTMSGTSIWLQSTGQADLMAVFGEYGVEAIGFSLFEALMPFPQVFSALFLLLVFSFLATTIDSSTLSVAMLTVDGNEDPSTINRVIWGVLIGLLTSILMVVGGFGALQAFIILVGLPSAILCAVALIGMTIEFEREFPVILSSKTWEMQSEEVSTEAGEQKLAGEADD